MVLGVTPALASPKISGWMTRYTMGCPYCFKKLAIFHFVRFGQFGEAKLLIEYDAPIENIQ
jgi:hypothetical protein